MAIDLSDDFQNRRLTVPAPSSPRRRGGWKKSTMFTVGNQLTKRGKCREERQAEQIAVFRSRISLYLTPFARFLLAIA
jgi:hypothetical protein